MTIGDGGINNSDGGGGNTVLVVRIVMVVPGSDGGVNDR